MVIWRIYTDKWVLGVSFGKFVWEGICPSVILLNFVVVEDCCSTDWVFFLVRLSEFDFFVELVAMIDEDFVFDVLWVGFVLVGIIDFSSFVFLVVESCLFCAVTFNVGNVVL